MIGDPRGDRQRLSESDALADVSAGRPAGRNGTHIVSEKSTQPVLTTQVAFWFLSSRTMQVAPDALQSADAQLTIIRRPVTLECSGPAHRNSSLLTDSLPPFAASISLCQTPMAPRSVNSSHAAEAIQFPCSSTVCSSEGEVGVISHSGFPTSPRTTVNCR